MATLVDNWSTSESVLKNPLNSSEDSMISFVDGAPSTVRLGEMSRTEDINGTTVMEKLEGVISVGVGEMEGEARMSWELNGWVSLMLVVVWRGRGEEGRGVPFIRSSGDTLLDSIIPRERYIKQTINKFKNDYTQARTVKWSCRLMTTCTCQLSQWEWGQYNERVLLPVVQPLSASLPTQRPIQH